MFFFFYLESGQWTKSKNPVILWVIHHRQNPTESTSSMLMRNLARVGEKGNAYRILVGKPEGKRPLGRPRRRWVDNIKINLREIAWDVMEWINLAQDRDR
jgi:ribosome biogenesis protein Tsr3